MQERSYSLANRILHWLIAFTFLFIILTVFLRENWMNKNNVGNIIARRLAGMNIHISQEDAMSIGKEIRRPMWNWHIYAGYFLIFLYIVRMIVMRIEGAVFENPLSRIVPVKERMKSWIYIIFYVCLAISLLTGVYVELGSRELSGIRDVAKVIHVQSLYYALAFIVLHMTGLVLAELTGHKGIVSKMIHGT